MCMNYFFQLYIILSLGAAVKLCLGDLLVMGSNPETASLQGVQHPSPIAKSLWAMGYEVFKFLYYFKS